MRTNEDHTFLGTIQNTINMRTSLGLYIGISYLGMIHWRLAGQCFNVPIHSVIEWVVFYLFFFILECPPIHSRQFEKF